MAFVNNGCFFYLEGFSNLENQLKIRKKCLNKDDNLSKYNAIKNELDAIYDNITKGICIRS